MLKNLKKMAIRLTAVGALTLVLTGCGNSTNSGSKDYDFYIFNTKSENAQSFEELCQIYEEETGVKIKIFSLGTTESLDTLRSEMNSSEKPALFGVNADTLTEWKEGGFILDLADVSHTELKDLANSVPESMRLKSEVGENFGIPVNIEGYGLIVNKQMLVDLFDLQDVETFIEDFKLAGYDEFQNLVVTVDAFIKENKVGDVALNGQSYTLAASKTELTSKLNGVFSIAGAEKWTYGDHYSNYALNTVFDSLNAAQLSTEDQVENLRVPIKKTVEQLDFLTQYAAGPNGTLERGPEFINSTVTGYDQAVQTFVDGKALFIKQGNWIYPNVEKLDAEVANNLTMLPMKVSFTDQDIKVEGLTAQKFNQSIPEFIPSYYALNKKVSEEEQQHAQDFLVWLYTSEIGKEYTTEKFAFVPFNATKETVLENPLSTDLITYMAEGNVLSNPFNGAPTTWGQEVYGKYLMEKLFIKKDWTDTEYDDMTNECISEWNNMRSY